MRLDSRVAQMTGRSSIRMDRLRGPFGWMVSTSLDELSCDRHHWRQKSAERDYDRLVKAFLAISDNGPTFGFNETWDSGWSEERDRAIIQGGVDDPLTTWCGMPRPWATPAP